MHSLSKTARAEAPRLLPADVKVCRALLRKNSKTFHAASLLLPQTVRESASVLYGFCRLADDEVDVAHAGVSAIASLRLRLSRVCSGQPLAEPTDRALAAVLSEHQIPREILELLIEGLEWDTEGRSYESLDELFDYATRVAGTVGAMMALLMGVRSSAGINRACELGIAMQLTNIARDVGEDARMGRIYLPLSWLRQAGIDPAAWLADPQFNEAIATVISRLLSEANLLYRGVESGIARLPLSCRPGINAARFLYQNIGTEIARAGFNSIDRRAFVPGHRKLFWVLRAIIDLMPRASMSMSMSDSAGLPNVRAILNTIKPAAINPEFKRVAGTQPSTWWRLDQRFVWVLSLFERLERIDRLDAAQPARRAT
jgi:15-cis-phytoene synthase